MRSLPPERAVTLRRGLMRHILKIAGAAALALRAGIAQATKLEAYMHLTTDRQAGKPIGRILIKATRWGALFVATPRGLPPGRRGFHIHDYGNCGVGMDQGLAVVDGAAAGHWKPLDLQGMRASNSTRHAMPMGDLPDLIVGSDGTATTLVSAPRIHRLDALVGSALMVHDAVGARIACGVIRPVSDGHARKIKGSGASH